MRPTNNQPEPGMAIAQQKPPRRITEFPHLTMKPTDIKELEDRQGMEDDPAFIAGMTWARERNLNAPVPGEAETMDEWLAVFSEIKEEADRRYPDDVVSESCFLDGAMTWSGGFK